MAGINETKASPQPDVTSYIEYQAAKILVKYIAPIVLFTGLAGNAMTVSVFLKRRIGKKSTRILLIALAVADSGVLLTGLLRYWIRDVTSARIDVRSITFLSCPVHTFLVYFLMHLAVWCLVMVTIERFISVTLPLKARWLCTPKRVVFGLAFTASCLLGLDAHILSGHRGVLYKLRIHCAIVDNNYYDFWNDHYIKMDLCFMSVVPFFIILICNVSILIKVGISHKKVHASSFQGSTTSARNKITSMTAMLLTINVVFLLTTLPMSIFLAFWTSYKPKSGHDLAVHDLVFTSLNILSYTNNACNFLLYCVSGHLFRRQFLSLICAKYRIQPAGVNANNDTNFQTLTNSVVSTISKPIPQRPSAFALVESNA